jgi:septal ring factor EnvC (AmiA/AmiB activator)
LPASCARASACDGIRSSDTPRCITGVDWAAPSGTPIYASGNGVIEKAGWESGYGKYIRVRHNNGYETAYGHMTAFARGWMKARACARAR